MRAWIQIVALSLGAATSGACATGAETPADPLAGQDAATGGSGGSPADAAAGSSGTGTGGSGTAGSAGAAGIGGSGASSGASGTGGTGPSGGSGGAGGAAGAGGSGLPPWTANPQGCADGTREGFADVAAFPFIAGCDGAWDVPGVFEMPVSCNREAGNSGPNSHGTGCSMTDLCAPGWRVCYGRDDVLLRNDEGCDGVMTGATSPVFFTTQMSSTGAFECSTQSSATNDLFGCGDLGCNFGSNTTVQQLCAPLTMSSHDLCKGLRNDLACGDWCNHLGKYPQLENSWDCGDDSENEALNVTKLVSGQGGVLCCIDESQ